MRDLIRGGETIHGRMRLFPVLNQSVHVGHLAVGQEHIARLCPNGTHVIDAVFFFFGSGEFVFLDQVVVVIGYGRKRDQSGLRPTVHHQFIDVVTRFALLEQRLLADHGLQILFGLIVNGLAMDIGTGGQIDLCFGYM